MSEPELPDAAALSRVVAVINGKGGVLKTSIVEQRTAAGSRVKIRKKTKPNAI